MHGDFSKRRRFGKLHLYSENPNAGHPHPQMKGGAPSKRNGRFEEKLMNIPSSKKKFNHIASRSARE
jgi:hypothetical protein